MSLEEFSSEKENHKYLKRFKKSWEKRFRPTRMEEIYEGVDLANYLIALERNEEAIKLLLFITEQIEFNGNYNIWSPTGSGIILLARLLRKKQSDKYEKVINRIKENDFRAENRRIEHYESTIQEHQEKIEKIKEETQKWSCHILSRHLMSLNYLMETATKSFTDTENFDRELLENKILECYEILRIRLK